MRGGRQLRSQFTKIASADITVACNYDGCTLMNSGSGSNCTMTTTLSEERVVRFESRGRGPIVGGKRPHLGRLARRRRFIQQAPRHSRCTPERMSLLATGIHGSFGR
jgi:hypothetical protein